MRAAQRDRSVETCMFHNPSGGPTCPDTWCSAPFRRACKSRSQNGGADLCGDVVQRNAEEGVTWINSFVRRTRHARSASMTRRRPRQSARPPTRNELPVDRITQVRVLDPYFYR